MFHPPLFGAALEDVMELQAETHPDMTIPWVIPVLCDAVLQLKGPQTEGIFRYIYMYIEECLSHPSTQSFTTGSLTHTHTHTYMYF